MDTSFHSFHDFFMENRQRLFNYLMRMTGDPELSADILQESFTRCLEKYAPRDATPALVFTVARNALLDHFRKERRMVPGTQSPDDLPDTSETAGAVVREEYRRVLAALERLSADERDLLSLVVSSRMPYREIARVTGLSLANVKVKVHRARVRLKTILSAEETP